MLSYLSHSWLNVARWPLSAQLLLLAALDTHLALYLSRQQDAQQTLSALLLAVLLFLLAIWRFDQEQNDARPLKLGWDRYDTWAIILLLLLAFALRGFNLERAPLAMHNDEAVIGVRTLALIDQPLVVFWLPDEWSLTKVWYYAQLPFLLLLGRTVAAVRIFSAIMGTLSVLSSYLLIRLLFTQRIAMGTAFLLATYHFHIHFSRVSLPNILDPLWGTLIFSCLVIGLATNRRFWFALGGVIMGVALHFYPGARLFIPLILLMGIAWQLAQRQPWRTWLWPEIWFPWLVIGLGFLVAAAPYLQAAWINPRFFLIRNIAAGVSAEVIAQAMQAHGWTPLRFWLEQLRHALLSFYLPPPPGYQGFYDNHLPLMRGLAAWLLAGGSLLALWHWRQWRYLLFIGWYLLTALVGGVLMAEPAAPQRFVTLTVAACLLVALALEQLRRWALFRWSAGRGPVEIFLIVCYLNLSITSVYRYYYYLANPAHYGTLSSQNGTALAFYLRQQPPQSEVWFVGKRANSVLHSHIPQYLAPHIRRNDLTHFPATEAGVASTSPSIHMPTNAAPTIFIIPFSQRQVRSAITRQYPGGVEELISWPGLEKPVLIAYKFE